MKVVNLVIAILVALGAAGAVFLAARAETEELQKKVVLLEDNLAQTKLELAQARQELAKADTSKLQEDLNDLSDSVWAKMGDLGKKDIEMEARIDKLASMPAPAASPKLADSSGSQDAPPEEDPDAEGVERLVRGVGRMFEGRLDQMTKRQTDRYKEELNLTESQAQDLGKVMSEQGRKMMEAIGKAFEGGGDVDRRALMEQFMAEREDAIREILTPEQFEKFKELEQNQMGWGGMFGGGGRRRDRGGDGTQPAPRPGGDR